MFLRMSKTIRGAVVALVVSCACGRSSIEPLGDGDAGGDVADVGGDPMRSEIFPDVDCPECGGICGDGILRQGEQCDDGNLIGGDGCSAICHLNPGWTCPVPGMPCQPN